MEGVRRDGRGQGEPDPSRSRYSCVRLGVSRRDKSTNAGRSVGTYASLVPEIDQSTKRRRTPDAATNLYDSVERQVEETAHQLLVAINRRRRRELDRARLGLCCNGRRVCSVNDYASAASVLGASSPSRRAAHLRFRSRHEQVSPRRGDVYQRVVDLLRPPRRPTRRPTTARPKRPLSSGRAFVAAHGRQLKRWVVDGQQHVARTDGSVPCSRTLYTPRSAPRT